MTCCKSALYEWCKDMPKEYQDVHIDSEGNSYCIFHAPKGKKGINANSFNRLVFERIEATQKDENSCCDLSGTIFDDHISFSHFYEGHPLPSVNFGGVQFEVVNFDDAYFSGRADFRKAQFKSYTIFNKAYFSEDADFIKAKFNDYVEFEKTKFNKGADFKDAQFNDYTTFIFTQFNWRASFQRARFRGKVLFKESQFNEYADFREAKFSESSSFMYTQFSKIANFRKAQFNNGIIFLEVYFNNAKFNYAKFDLASRFEGLQFYGDASLSHIIVTGSLTFIRVNLRIVSFFFSDISMIEFIDCLWAKKYGRNVLYDELLIYDQKDRPFPEASLSTKLKWHIIQIIADIRADRTMFAQIESLYSRFLNKAKNLQRTHDASDWHYGEKEMFRKKSWLRRFNPLSLTNLYWLSSGYGERPVRAGIGLAALLMLATVALGFTGLPPKQVQVYGQALTRFTSCSDVLAKLWQFPYLAAAVIQYATFQKDSVIPPESISSAWLKLAVQLLVPAQATLFFLAVRNRFKRFI